MSAGKLVFSQVMDHLPWHTLQRCVRRYDGNRKVKSFQCSDHYRCMAFAQLTYPESLRGIETCLRAQASKLYPMGITSRVSRNTLANANHTRDWRLYADFAQRLIHTARHLHIDPDPGLDVAHTVYALDSSTIDLCLTIYPWAHFRKTQSAIKLHTLLDLRAHIPAFIHFSDGTLHDVNVLDLLLPEAGAFYLMDRGYLDFARLYRLHQARCCFLLRANSNTRFRRLYFHAVDRSSGLICDQTLLLTGAHSATHYLEKLRRIQYHDTEQDRTLVFLTNQLTLPPLTIAALYRSRWPIELFFRWIKQHLRIKAFYGTSDNSVKSQVWIAVSVYVLIAIIKKRLQLEPNLYTILQILSLTVFEKTPLDQLLRKEPCILHSRVPAKQLILFD
jgi:hypothetical protein